MIDYWLSEWLIDWLVGWLINWLIAWLIGYTCGSAFRGLILPSKSLIAFLISSTCTQDKTNCTLTSWLPLVTSSWLPPHRCGAFLLRVSSSGTTLLDSCLPMDAAAGVGVWMCRCEEGIGMRRRVSRRSLSVAYLYLCVTEVHKDSVDTMIWERLWRKKHMIMQLQLWFCTQLSILLCYFSIVTTCTPVVSQ